MNIPKAISMIDFHSDKTQKVLLRGFYVLSFIMLISPMVFFDALVVSDLFQSTFNFIGTLDPSGLLIFAGVASGITYLNKSLIPYRNIAFTCGFLFALAQAAIAAMKPMAATFFEPSLIQAILLSAVFISGFGFIIFSFLAMAVAAYDLENDQVIASNVVSKEVKSSEAKITLNPAVKTDSVQPSPAPADLAHDLRYSRSRARRSPGRR